MPTNRIRRRVNRFFRPLVEQLEARRLLAAVITVNSTADTNTRDAFLTLREAILINNRTLAVATLSALEQAQVSGSPTNTDTDTINFGIVGVGVQTISPTTALPNITDPVTINGYSQPGASANSAATDQPLNTVLQIQLAGNSSGGATGLRLAAGSGGSTIRGLAINRFSNGIWIDSSGNTIAGNFLGTNPAGTAASPNSANGILIIDGDNNTIGGTAPADANVISGNATNGITVVTNAATTVIRGNRIGTDLTGTVDLGNTVYGVFTDSAPGTVIGGSAVGAGNLISGNNSHGILLQNASHDSVIQGNKIGTTLAGTAALANGGDGIRIETSSRITVGGNPGGNTIAFNTGNGIRDVAFSSLFQANSIFSNGQLGIDRGTFAGQTYPPTSEAVPYPLLTDVSEAGGATTVKGVISHAGVAIDLAYRIEFFASSQADPSGFGEGQTYLGFLNVSIIAGGSGQTLFTATLPALPGGQPLVTATATDITPTSGTPANITSEFSPPLAANMPPTILTVTTTADSGTGSLRAAIQAANSHPGADRIEFNLPASDAGHVYYKNDNVAGKVALANVTPTSAATDTAIADIDPDWPHSWFTFRPISPLPDLADMQTTIDGYTQPGSAQNTNSTSQGLNSVLKIEINGEANDNHTLTSSGLLRFAGTLSGYGTVRGLVLNRAYNPDGSVPVVLLGAGLNSYHIEGNYLGTDVSGTLSLPASNASGDFDGGVLHVLASDSVIGGVTPAARNLVRSVIIPSGAGSAQRTRVEGNLVGTNRSGLRGLTGGGSIGGGGDDAVIGGPDSAARNVVAGGVFLTGHRALVQNNLLGIDITGTERTGPVERGGVGLTGNDNRVLQNTVAYGVIGVNVSGSGNRLTQNTIEFCGNGIAIDGNQNQVSQNSVISNRSTGITIQNGTGNLLSQNTTYGNTGIGINLVKAGDNVTGGVTPNDVPPASDPPDQDTGPNGLQNFPLLTSVTAVGASTHIEGTLASTPSSNFRLEFFASAERDEASGGLVAEGQTYFGSLDVTTNANGNATITVDFPVNLLTLPGTKGQPYVTATATDITDPGSGPRNNTSEFSIAAPLGGASTVVTSTADSGLGTLREAILNANFTSSRQTITFAIPPSDARHFYYRDDGVAGEVKFENTTPTSAAADATIIDIDPDWPHSWFNILLDRELPAITDTITIDGYSQPGSSRNTRAFPDRSLDTVLKIELDGRNIAGDGLNLSWSSPTQSADASVIQGLSINAFGRHGILLRTLGGGNTVAGNFIGPDVSGLLNFGNSGDGVFVVIEDNTTIGGADAGDRNLISGNISNQVEVLSGSGGHIIGDSFNGDRTGEVHFATIGASVFIHNDEDRLPANTTASPISSLGIQQQLALRVTAQQAPSDSREYEISEITENRPTHLPIIYWGPLENYVVTGYKVTVGKSSLIVPKAHWNKVNLHKVQKYLVQKNKQAQSTQRATAAAVEEAQVTLYAVDLGGDGITPNDPGDFDNGPNDLQNYPVVASATTRGGGVTFVAALDSLPAKEYRIEFYVSSYDTSVFRAGEQSLGTMDVTTDASGHASFVYESSQSLPVGYHVSALATRLEDHDNNSATPVIPYETSEFGEYITLRDNPWHNAAKPLDADPDGKTAPGDALVIINRINAAGSGLVPPEAQPGDPYRYDTSNDAYVAPNDALLVINYINEFGAEREGEGEGGRDDASNVRSTFPAGGSRVDMSPDLLALLAADIAAQPKRRRP